MGILLICLNLIKASSVSKNIYNITWVDVKRTVSLSAEFVLMYHVALIQVVRELLAPN